MLILSYIALNINILFDALKTNAHVLYLYIYLYLIQLCKMS